MNDDVPSWIERARGQWTNRGRARPPFAVAPKDGQESVWDYPRPPRLEPDEREIVIIGQGAVIARTRGAYRVLETSHPPTFYLPPDDVDATVLRDAGRGSICEWKGEAAIFDVVVGDASIPRAAWGYPVPYPEFAAIRGYFAFYPEPLVCTVAGARVQRQPGRFYGGWITPELVGPFKGEPGTDRW